MVANQSVERTVGKLRAVGCSKVSYSKTCRVGGRRFVQDGLRPLQRRHVQPLHGEDEVNLFPKSLGHGRGQKGCLLLKLITEGVPGCPALNAVDLDDRTDPIGTQVMGLFGTEANALGVLGTGFFPMSARKPEIGEFGIQLGASRIEVEFTLNERYGSVFKMQLQPEVGGLHNDARSQFGFARQEPTLRLFECSQR